MAYKDKEKERKTHKIYVEKNKEEIDKYKKEWYENNKEKLSASAKKYYIKNKDKIKQRNTYRYNNNINGEREAKKAKSRDHRNYIMDNRKKDPKYLAEALYLSIISGNKRSNIGRDNKKDIINFILNSKEFEILHNLWVQTNNDKYCPSVARCNTKEGFFVWNLFISTRKHINNRDREHINTKRSIPVILTDSSDNEIIFKSISDCARHLLIHCGSISRALKKGYYKDYKIRRADNDEREI